MLNNDIMDGQYNSESESLYVVVKNPEGTLFEGKALTVSSLNDKGKFDILPNHANFISIIKQKAIVYIDKNKKREFDIDHGIVRLYKNNVFIFLGIETMTGQNNQANI